jgi:hypothetical protein
MLSQYAFNWTHCDIFYLNVAMRSTRRAFGILVFAVLVSATMTGAAVAEGAGPPSVAAQGVRPVLRGTLALDTSSPYAKAAADKLVADLRVSLWLSDHAPEADFFGLVVTNFKELSLGERRSETTIWQASQCHRDRGLPKVKISGIEGSIFEGRDQVQISAKPRHIGKRVPADEIVVTKQPAESFGGSESELLMRFKSKQSQLVLDLRLRSARCELRIP